MAPASLGIFLAEGGLFIGGKGMNADNRLKTAAALSTFWDGQSTKRLRAGDGYTLLHGRPLSAHLMLQPDVARGFLGDPILRDQGPLSRFLVAQPPSLAGQRHYREASEAELRSIEALEARLITLLRAPQPLVDGKANELNPPALPLSAQASETYQRFYDAIETQVGPGGPLEGVVDFAAKAAELAARLAGVLTVIDNVAAKVIDVEVMTDAVALMRWYVGEVVRVRDTAQIHPSKIAAEKLLDWIRKKYPGTDFSLRDVCQGGPNRLRPREKALEALKVLIEHGWLEDRGKGNFRLRQGERP